MFERIVVPLDGSATAERVLSQVARFLRRQDSEVILMRSVFVPPSLARLDTTKILQAERKAADAYLEAQAERLRAQGIRARGRRVDGPAAEAILDGAREEKATLIAMSTHGRSGVQRWVLGSVAEKVVRAAEVPVLLLHSFLPDGRGRVPLGDGRAAFRRILVPLDGSENGRAVLPAAEAAAKLFEAELLFLHVADEHGAPAEAELAAAQARASAAGLKSSPFRMEGDPAGRILDAAEAEGADLIAISTHGRSGLSRWMLGSVAERVLRASSVPLLVVRAPGAPSP